MIKVTCGGCAQSFNARDELAGRKGKCPSCGAPITVPEAAPSTASGPQGVASHASVVAPGRRSGSRRRPAGGRRRAGATRRSKGGLGGVLAVIGIALAVAAAAYYLHGGEPDGQSAFAQGQSAMSETRYDEAMTFFEQVPPGSSLYSLAREKLAQAREERDAGAASARVKSANALYAAIQSIEQNYVVPEAPMGANYAPYARYLLKRSADFVQRFGDDPRASELKQYGFKYAKVASLDQPPSEADVEAEIQFRCLLPKPDYARAMGAVDEFAALSPDNDAAARRMRDGIQARSLDYWKTIHARLERDGSLDPGAENWQRVANECYRYLSSIEGLQGLTASTQASALYAKATGG